MSDRDPGAGREPTAGVLASLRSLAATAAGIAQARLQLLANELEEQGVRGLQIITLAAIALFCAGMGVMLFTAWIVIALWDQYRLLTVGVLALVYFVGCAVSIRSLKTRVAERPKLFSASVAELRRDQDWLRSR